MPIASTDIVFRLSVTTGPGDSTAQANPNLSLGEFLSTSAWAGGVLHDLFDAVTGDENAASDVEYRCVFILNNHGTLTLTAPVVWISAETAGGASIAIAIDGVAATAKGSSTAQADEVANESTAPSGEVFSSPTTKGTGLALGDLAPAQVRAIWIRRSAANTAPLANDGATIRVEGDTL